MKKSIVVISTLLISVLLASCFVPPSSEPPVQSPPPAPAPAPEPAPPVIEVTPIDTSSWQTYTFMLDGREVSLKLPDGVYVDPQEGSGEFMSTPETAPPGFLVNPVYNVIKVGQIYTATNYQKMDENTYQTYMYSHEEDEDIPVIFTYSEEIGADVFSRYGDYIVFINAGGSRGFLDSVDYYNEDSGIMIAFWFPQSADIFEQDGKPMFEAIVSTVQVN